VFFSYLRKKGYHLFGQSVLLKGINDSLAALCELCFKMFKQGVTPYYLHQLDAAYGTSCYKVAPAEGKRLIKALRELNSGYLVPRYVKELAGYPCKVPLENFEVKEGAAK